MVRTTQLTKTNEVLEVLASKLGFGQNNDSQQLLKTKISSVVHSLRKLQQQGTNEQPKEGSSSDSRRDQLNKEVVGLLQQLELQSRQKTLNVGLGTTPFLTDYLYGKIQRVCEKPMESLTITLNRIKSQLGHVINTFVTSVQREFETLKAYLQRTGNESISNYGKHQDPKDQTVSVLKGKDNKGNLKGILKKQTPNRVRFPHQVSLFLTEEWAQDIPPIYTGTITELMCGLLDKLGPQLKRQDLYANTQRLIGVDETGHARFPAKVPDNCKQAGSIDQPINIESSTNLTDPKTSEKDRLDSQLQPKLDVIIQEDEVMGVGLVAQKPVQEQQPQRERQQYVNKGPESSSTYFGIERSFPNLHQEFCKAMKVAKAVNVKKGQQVQMYGMTDSNQDFKFAVMYLRQREFIKTKGMNGSSEVYQGVPLDFKPIVSALQQFKRVIIVSQNLVICVCPEVFGSQKIVNVSGILVDTQGQQVFLEFQTNFRKSCTQPCKFSSRQIIRGNIEWHTYYQGVLWACFNDTIELQKMDSTMIKCYQGQFRNSLMTLIERMQSQQY